MKFLTNIDLNKNQLLNATLQNLAVAPASPSKGQAYFNTGDNKAYVYNGTSWVDITEVNMSGDQIVTALNASSSVIDNDNLSTTVNDAITKRHSQNSDIGTSSATFYFGTGGTKIKNITGGLAVRNNADSSYENLQALNLIAEGALTTKGNTTLGDAPASDVHTINGKTTVKSGSSKETGSSTTNVFEVVDSASSPLFEVKQNGDSVIAGRLTVQSVSGGGGTSLTGSTTMEDLTISNTLRVNGNTYLGDNASVDVTEIKGLTTIKTGVTKALGSASTNAFRVLSSDDKNLFEVRQNGDTVIGGVLTVQGTGASSFAGDVNIGGNLHVDGNVTGGTQVDLAENLTVTGNLLVNGNTTLGDDPATDKLTINAYTTMKSKTTKALGSSSSAVFSVMDNASTPAPLFQVMENGDTVIGGVLTVQGTGTSTFAGDVNIGGALSVAKGATVNAGLSGDSLTLTGNLVVNGNTTLGDSSTDKLNVVATTVLPTQTTIGAVTYTNLNDSVSKRHSQNTDVGTSSSTFYIGSSGNKLKNSGTEIQIRNNADNAYADLRVNNLIVEGATTTINSNTVNIGDNQILLNSDVTTSSTNSDGGIAIKRLKADNTTRADAELNFNNSTGRWETVLGSVTRLTTTQLTNKVTASIGNGTLTSIVVTHNLNTRDLSVSVRETASPYSMVYPDIEMTSVDTITLKFATAPTANEFTVTIIG